MTAPKLSRKSVSDVCVEIEDAKAFFPFQVSISYPLLMGRGPFDQRTFGLSCARLARRS
jgi:hypothetical protein